MFDSLSDRLGGVLDKLRGKGILSEKDVSAALREVRVALLEADVALPVVKDFINSIKDKAVGEAVLKSVSPGQQVVKIVHDGLIEMLGGDPEADEGPSEGFDVVGAAPAALLMVGLQGSGKTTTTAKIAKRLSEKKKKKVLMASLDVTRPAAQEQLKILGEQLGIATLPIIPGQMPVDIANRAMQSGRLQGMDVVILDTAGRLHVDAGLMQEVMMVKAATNPVETLLVADSLTGQDAVNVAKAFNDQVGITGSVLTRMDGDGRGGAALSMRAVTGKPIRLIGTGEKMDGLEDFHAKRIAGRILGMGDVVSLVEKAVETIEEEEAEKLAKKLQKAELDMDDMLMQLRQMKKMGGMKGVLSMLPGIGKAAKQMSAAGLDESLFNRQEAIILSMTKKERAKPQLLNASRKKRIAAGSGVHVNEINKLLKMRKQMVTAMKRMNKLGGKMPGMPGMGGMGGLGSLLGGGPKLPPGMDKLIKK